MQSNKKNFVQYATAKFNPLFSPKSAVMQFDDWERIPIYVREKQLRSDVFTVSHGALWQWVAEGTFPPPSRLSSGVTAWKRSDLKAWAEGTWLPVETK